jgi:hypothetical protein
LTVARCNARRCSLTKKLLPAGFMWARCFSHAPISRSSSPRKGCVVDSLQSGDMQDAALHVQLVELQPAGFRDPETVAEHEQQQATVTRFVAVAPGRADQPFHLESGQVLAVGVARRVSVPAAFH